MKKINSVKNLPDWFDIKQYMKINRCSDDDLWEELEQRSEMFQITFRSNLKSFLYVPSEKNSRYKKIQSGNISLKGHDGKIDFKIEREEPCVELEKQHEKHDRLYDNYMDKYKDYMMFGDSWTIQPITLSSIISYSNICNKFIAKNSRDSERNSKMSSSIHSNVIGKTSVDLILAKSKTWNRQVNDDKINISVNLNFKSDEDLIKEFAESLPEWRKQLKAKEPYKFLKGRSDDIQKLRRYQALAFIDLYFWSLSNNTKIKKSVLAIALFPDGDKGEFELKQTIEPFISKVFANNYQRVEK